MKSCTKEVISPDYKFKIILIGESGAGKTSILLRFTENRFNENHLPTIGVDFKSKWLVYQKKTLKLQIWDTAGQERFASITRSYYKNCHGALAIYDITDRSSFEKVEALIKYYREESEAEIPMNIVLVGNKCDLFDRREITYEEGKTLSDTYNIPFLETSVKNNENINEIFYKTSTEALKASRGSDDNEVHFHRLDAKLKSKKGAKKSKCW